MSHQRALKQMRALSWRFPLVTALLIFAGFVIVSTALFIKSPEGTVLLDTPDASWIMADTAYSLNARSKKGNHRYFLREFDLNTLPGAVKFHVRGFRSYQLWVNGHEVAMPAKTPNLGINVEVVVDIAPFLLSGKNKVLIRAGNQQGPPAILAYSPIIGLRTNQTWLSGKEVNAIEEATRLLSQPVSHPLNSNSAIKGEVFQSVAFYILILFALGFVLTIFFNKISPVYGQQLVNIHVARWLFLVAWVVLCANNFLKLPHYIGFDISAHEEYVLYILQHGRLPLASDGWQMFQPPLFYLLSAPIYSIAENWFGAERAWYALRLLPMFSGLVILEMSYRSSLLVFKERRDLQLFSFCIAASIPMTYYITQTVGNEPLSGALTAVLIYSCFRYLDGPKNNISLRPALVTGALFGLVLLTKITVVLLLPVLFAVYWFYYVESQASNRYAMKAGAIFFVTSGLVSGWYFLRNWLHFSKPFVGGWDDVRGISWWQDPGYRMLGDVFHFGDVLISPIYAAIFGFWDGVYSTLWLDGYLSSIVVANYAPPWNYSLMLTLAWLALPLTLALIVGMLKTLQWRAPLAVNTLQVAAASIVCYLLGMLYLYMQLPIYSTVKFTYALGLVPCLGLLTAFGVSELLRYPLLRAVMGGYLMVWVGFVYSAFFIW